ncbi:MAG: DNA polymerase III subunit gamma/tau [Candidatus Omnitrophica bacterium]|nr:DNA polymerase III subunit gamma/tau [Candidatus Omnitrophota bacterium]
MSYIVFARKWRPQTFDDILGQDHIITTLKNAISGKRVAHAYIFTGPRGIGKTSVARILAKGLNCEQGPTPSPCNKCASCTSISSGTSMDVIEIDGASNNSVDQVRELRENIRFMPSYGKHKVYIIDEVHMLSMGAFNALLKTLEEPPKHANFIFATTNPEKVPATVLSRCQRFDFRRVSLKLITSKLEKISRFEKLDISSDATFSIAKASDGSVRDAESVLDQLTSFCEKKISQEDVIAVLGIIEEDTLADIIEKLHKKDTQGLLKVIDGLIATGKDISQFLSGLMGYLRNMMVLKVSPQLSSVVDLPDEYIVKIGEQAKNFEMDDLLYMFYTIAATANAVKRSELSRYIVEVMLIKLSLRAQMMPLSEIVDKVAQLESDIGKRVPSEAGQKQHFSGVPERTEPEPEPRPFPREDENHDTSAAAETGQLEAPEAKTALTIESIKKAWPRVLQMIKGKKISVASYLLEGELSEAKGSIVTIGFPKRFNFHRESLERANNKKLVEETISGVLGHNVLIDFTTLKDSKPASETTEAAPEIDEELEREAAKDTFDEPMIQSALDIFDGRIVKGEFPPR